MKPLGSVVGNLAEGYQDQDPARTPESSSSRTSPAFVSEFVIGNNPKLKPMEVMEAAEFVDRLLRNYPNLNAHDPKGYIIALGEIFAEFPEWAGEQAIVRLADESPDFPPTGPRLRKTLSEIVSPHRHAAEWNAQAQKQLAEREKRDREVTKEPLPPPQGRIVTYGEAVAMGMTRPIGVFEDHHMGAKRDVPYRG
jgi:hypothetical protein